MFSLHDFVHSPGVVDPRYPKYFLVSTVSPMLWYPFQVSSTVKYNFPVDVSSQLGTWDAHFRQSSVVFGSCSHFLFRAL